MEFHLGNHQSVQTQAERRIPQTSRLFQCRAAKDKVQQQQAHKKQTFPIFRKIYLLILNCVSKWNDDLAPRKSHGSQPSK
ncbi:Os03g0109450 [Oryza sativa Japonica Group]|uniref:Os03g0109450 protein n=1 Tax=Oryza sativa subsp. japonica TaxID=39947 RepID=A0A0P0VS21_ORYSJ|nr:hypothetical protein EE612_014844 [Oryza sativa]BAS81906.1 Os03g0109450 [Oryza sativa Japonica Group]